MKVLVTGSKGFIGTHLCKMLEEDGHQVIGLDLKNGHDINDCFLPEVDRVFHLAAQTDARCDDAEEDARQNITATIRLMSWYRSKVTFASSCAVNFLTSPYGISKLAGEHYARLFGCGIVRFCNIHGPGSNSFMDIYRELDFVNAFLPGEQIRTYAHVSEACEALLYCKPGQLFVLQGEELTVQQIIDTVYKGKKVYWFGPNKYDVIDGRQV
jgi:nucleoside-diphosphate-sugar epimerase